MASTCGVGAKPRLEGLKSQLLDALGLFLGSKQLLAPPPRIENAAKRPHSRRELVFLIFQQLRRPIEVLHELVELDLHRF